SLHGERELVHPLIQLAPQQLGDRTLRARRATAQKAREVAVRKILHRFDVDIELRQRLTNYARAERRRTLLERPQREAFEIFESIAEARDDRERKRGPLVHQRGQRDAPSATLRP